MWIWENRTTWAQILAVIDCTSSFTYLGLNFPYRIGKMMVPTSEECVRMN